MKGVVGLVIAVVIFVALVSHHGSPSSSSTSSSSAPTDPTMGTRTRVFVVRLRDCQTAVRLLREALGSVTDSTDPVTLATASHETKTICDGASSEMYGLDTTHFDSQALDAEVAVEEYSNGVSDVSDYIDTSKPSDIPSALDHFANGNSAAAQAIQEINTRRQLYGFGNI